MKKIAIAQLFLSANIKTLFAATGERSDDYLILLVPFLFLTIAWAGYETKTRIKARRDAKNETPIDLHTIEDSLASRDL